MTPYAINRQILSTLKAQRRALGNLHAAAQADLVETQVYIGLNDGETKQQEHDTEAYVSILKRVCVEYGVPFSFDIVNGGYIHENGEYTEENTIALTFIDVDQDTVDKIARDLCAFFRQESVLVTTDRVRARMIRESFTD